MPILRPKLDIAGSRRELPAPIMFRSAHVPRDGLYPRHRHAWGEFVYAFSGVMEVQLAGQHLLAPPPYGIWLPPDVEHIGMNRLEAHHCSLYVGRTASVGLPVVACALTVTPLVRALLDHLRRHERSSGVETVQHTRLMQVLVDQLAQAGCADSYLPLSDDGLLAPILRALQDDAGDNRGVAEFARDFHTTERTLVRRCQRELGMSLSQWRQRLRVVTALPRLEGGDKVESIALDLGYGSASAFIAMFRRMMSVTPDDYRKRSDAQARQAIR